MTTAFVLVALVSGTAWSAIRSVLAKALLGAGAIVLLAAIHRGRRQSAADEPHRSWRFSPRRR